MIIEVNAILSRINKLIKEKQLGKLKIKVIKIVNLMTKYE